jgi:hypothetical protein
MRAAQRNDRRCAMQDPPAAPEEGPAGGLPHSSELPEVDEVNNEVNEVSPQPAVAAH